MTHSCWDLSKVSVIAEGFLPSECTRWRPSEAGETCSQSLLEKSFRELRLTGGLSRVCQGGGASVSSRELGYRKWILRQQYRFVEFSTLLLYYLYCNRHDALVVIIGRKGYINYGRISHCLRIHSTRKWIPSDVIFLHYQLVMSFFCITNNLD